MEPIIIAKCADACVYVCVMELIGKAEFIEAEVINKILESTRLGKR